MKRKKLFTMYVHAVDITAEGLMSVYIIYKHSSPVLKFIVRICSSENFSLIKKKVNRLSYPFMPSGPVIF